MPEHDRQRTWLLFADEVDRAYDRVRELRVTPVASTSAALELEVERRFPLDRPATPEALLTAAGELLREHLVHVTHPRYFGLFNPSVRESAVLGDALVALYNPQVAVRAHAPAAAAMERHVLRALGRLVGFEEPDGSFFTSGGQEANLAAVAAALAQFHPDHAQRGLAALPCRPALYVSAEAHDSFVKIARLTGLGTDAVRRVPVGPGLAMDVTALAQGIAQDRASGLAPLLVVGTAGTTAGGAIDPLPEIAEIAAREGSWFHVDAAWGGLAALSPRLRPLLRGIERADSVTWDAHKTLAVPMGAGMFFCRHPAALGRAFGVSASYMPAQAGEPYTTTPQWSRRAIGVKVLLSLAELGFEGWRDLVEWQVRMADRLRERLANAGWRVIHPTRLPLVCFQPGEGAPLMDLARAAALVQERGRAWISLARIGGETVLRACITSFRTDEGDLDVLLEELAEARIAASG